MSRAKKPPVVLRNGLPIEAANLTRREWADLSRAVAACDNNVDIVGPVCRATIVRDEPRWAAERLVLYPPMRLTALLCAAMSMLPRRKRRTGGAT